MDKFWILAIIAGLAGWVSCQSNPAHVPEPTVSAKLNSPANFSCDAHKQPLSICLWEKQNTGTSDRNVITINSSMRDGQATRVAGISYIGEGLDSGMCGLRIGAVKELDNGRWTCTLITKSGDTVTGTVEINILKKPEPPQFDKSLGRLTDGEEKVITCYSNGGQPAPKFAWYLGSDPIESNLSPIKSQNDSTKTTTYQQLTIRFTPEHSGKKLKCVTISPALSPEDKNEVEMDVVVTYAPRAPSNKINVRVPELGSEAVIAVNISSNPEPRIYWTVKGIKINSGFKSPDLRFEARPPRQVSSEEYTCELVIKKVEEGDLSEIYRLTAENIIGSGQFELKLSATNTENGGLSAGGIVGLVLGIPVILILIALVVVYARAKGLLCFKGDDGTSSEKERMDGDGDSNKGASEEKPTLSSRFSAFYENLVKKKDKTAPVVDEEAVPNKEQPEVKKSDDIVYAELDLARGEGAAQPTVRISNEDKTEYAEIVGVAPSEEEKKKSPTGSNNPSPKK